MELLQNLQTEIEKLQTNPSEVNIDQVVDLLSQAYELARDGLNRSQNADQFLKAQKRIEQLEPEMTSLKEQVETLASENKSHKENLEAISVFAEHVRTVLRGKVELMPGWNDEMKKLYSEKLDNGDMGELVKLSVEIENRFASEYKDSGKTLSIDDRTLVNPQLYEL